MKIPLKEHRNKISLSHPDSLIIKFVYFSARKLFGWLVRLIWIKRVEGVKNIPEHGAVIVAFNHQSYFDFLCFIAVSPRNIHFLSAEKFFSSAFWLPIMRLTGQIKVDRQSHDKREMHALVAEHIKSGRMIGIFPEGTRAEDSEKMRYAFSGVAKYAIWNKIPVVPVGLKGTFHVMSRFDKKPKFKKCVEITVGAPIVLSDYWKHKMNKKAFRFITDKIMLAISDLSGKKYEHVGVIKPKKKKKKHAR